jgi:hypothetical protein
MGNAFASTMAAGFASGGIMGGNIESALQGAFTAAMFYGVGEISGMHTPGVDKSFLSNAHIAQTAGHAVVGCFSASIAGGSCGSGAASAGFAAAAGPLLPGADISAARFVSRMIVGGIASRLAGGSFANGATSAAFAYLFNDVAGARDADSRADGACGGKGAMTPSNACYAARQLAAKEWADVPRSQALQNVSPELDLLGAWGVIKGAFSFLTRSLTSDIVTLTDISKTLVNAEARGGVFEAERLFASLPRTGPVSYSDTPLGVVRSIELPGGGTASIRPFSQTNPSGATVQFSKIPDSREVKIRF